MLNASLNIKKRQKYEPLRYQSPGIDRTEDHAAPDGTTVLFPPDRLSPCIGRGIGVF